MTAPQLEFECRACGERHVGLPAFGFDGPAQLRVVPAEERDERVELTDDVCVIQLDGTHRFVRGQLEIPIHGTAEPFTWGVWVSLSEASLARYLSLFDDEDRKPGESFFAWLCSALPEYPDTMFLKARLHTRSYPWRPWVALEPTDHPLAVDQHEGISRERAIALAERLLHSDEAEDPPDAEPSSTK